MSQFYTTETLHILRDFLVTLREDEQISDVLAAELEVMLARQALGTPARIRQAISQLEDRPESR